MDQAAAAAAPQVVVDYRASKVADLPLFNGDGTDAIKPDDFVRKIDAAKLAMRWDNGTTAIHFKASLRGRALEWLKGKEFKDTNVDDWDNSLRQVFIKDYVKSFKEINTLTTISHLALKGDETPRDLESRMCTIFADIKKNRPIIHSNMPANPEERDEAWVDALMNRSMNHCMLHIMKCIFVSALPSEMQNKILERKPDSLDDTVDVAQEIHEMKKNAKPAKIEVVETKFEEEWTKEKIEAIQDPDIKEAVITAIQRRQNGNRQNYSGQNQNYSGQNQNYSGQNQSRQQPQQQRQGQNSQGYRQNNQNQNNRAPVSCYYCKKQYHIQANCRIRLERNAPYNNAQGKPMNTPGTPEFSAWKSELQAKGKNVMIINDSENTINNIHSKNF